MYIAQPKKRLKLDFFTKPVKGRYFRTQGTKNVFLIIAAAVLLAAVFWSIGGGSVFGGNKITENQAKHLVESYYAALMERDYSKAKSVTTSRFQLEKGMADENLSEALGGVSVGWGPLEVDLNMIRDIYDTIEGKKMALDPVKGSMQMMDEESAAMNFLVVEGANLRQEAMAAVSSLFSSEEPEDQSREYYLNVEFQKVGNKWLIDRINFID